MKPAGKIFISLPFIFALIILIVPGVSSAALPSIWDNTGSGGQTCNIQGPCSFCDGLIVIGNIITFLFDIAVPIAVAMIVYGAIRLMIAGGSEQQVKKGKQIITSAVVGLAIALSAWAIVNTILHILAGNINFPWSTIECAAR